MELNQQGLSLPDELDDREYYFIREHNDQGVAFRREGELKDAIAKYDRVLTIKGDVAVVYNNRGVAWLEKGHVDRAIADFKRALELDPELFKAHRRLSKSLREGAKDRVCQETENI